MFENLLTTHNVFNSSKKDCANHSKNERKKDAREKEATTKTIEFSFSGINNQIVFNETQSVNYLPNI